MEKEKTEITLVHLRALRRKYFALKQNQNFVSDRILRIANDFEQCDFKGLFYSFADTKITKYHSRETIAFCEYCKKANDLLFEYKKKYSCKVFSIDVNKIQVILENTFNKKANEINKNEITDKFVFLKIMPKVTHGVVYFLDYVDFNKVYKTLLTPEWNILTIQDQFEDAYFKADYAVKAKKLLDLGANVDIGVAFGFKNVIPFIKDRINELLAH